MVEDQASNNFNALQLVRGHQTPGTFASPVSKKASVSGIIRLRDKGSCGIAYLLLTANKSNSYTIRQGIWKQQFQWLRERRERSRAQEHDGRTVS
jgi:hypothetical protein